jgi:hypothetical protein
MIRNQETQQCYTRNLNFLPSRDYYYNDLLSTAQQMLSEVHSFGHKVSLDKVTPGLGNVW